MPEFDRPGGAGERAETRLREAIVDKLLEANDIEVPRDLVNNEVAMMVMELNHRMKYESMASGGYFILTKEEAAERMETFKEEAFKLVKTRLLLRRIVEAEKIEVSRDELEEEASAIAERQRMPVEMVKDLLGEDLELVKEDLLVRKAIDFICANAVFG